MVSYSSDAKFSHLTELEFELRPFTDRQLPVVTDQRSQNAGMGD
jgi:hypothetical protein